MLVKLSKNIAYLIIILLVLVSIYYLFNSKRTNIQINLLPPISDAMKPYHFKSKLLPLSNINGGISYSFSIWIYITNWTYKYGREKVILNWSKKKTNNLNERCKVLYDDYKDTDNKRVKKEKPTNVYIKKKCRECGDGNLIDNLIVEPFKSKNQNTVKDFYSLRIVLDNLKNNLIIKQSLINGSNSKILIPNIPIQKWLNITVILNQRDLDIFINSKLENSIKLNSIPQFSKGDLTVTPSGGYNGYISNLNYYNYPITIDQIIRNFKKGPKNYNPFIKPKGNIGTFFHTKNVSNDGLNISNNLIRNIKKNNVLKNKFKNKKSMYGELCHKNQECKDSLGCVRGRCQYKNQSRKLNMSCYSNSDCKSELLCNNYGQDNLTSNQIQKLNKLGIPVDNNSSYNKSLSNNPFKCTIIN